MMLASIKVVATLTSNSDPRAVYERVTQFSDYPRHCPDVRSVVIEPDPVSEEITSSWEVNFRGGIMRWRERDTFDDKRLIAAFDQIDGDLNEFRGHWQIRNDPT